MDSAAAIARCSTEASTSYALCLERLTQPASRACAGADHRDPVRSSTQCVGSANHPASLIRWTSRRKLASCRSSAHEPASRSAIAFAPATVANLGPGFDWLGCAVDVSPSAVAVQTRHPDLLLHTKQFCLSLIAQEACWLAGRRRYSNCDSSQGEAASSHRED